MPTCRRKRVVLTEPSDDLIRALETDPEREVFYLEETGEIFETYEYVSILFLPTQPDPPSPPSSRVYVARMSFYRLKQFQCEVTGKSGLDYFQAVESERQEARTMHTRFSEPLKYPVLRAVQWRMSILVICSSNLQLKQFIQEVMGRLDHLVEAVYERFKDRYFKNESASYYIYS